MGDAGSSSEMSGGGSGNDSGDMGVTPARTQEWRQAFGPLAPDPMDARITFNFRQKRAEARAKRLGTAVEFLRPPKRPFVKCKV